MRMTTRLAFVVVAVAATVIALMYFDNRNQVEISNELVELRQSHEQISLLMQLDAAIDEQVHLLGSRELQSSTANRLALQAQAHQLLTKLATATLRSGQLVEMCELLELEYAQLALEQLTADGEEALVVDDMVRDRIAREETQISRSAAVVEGQAVNDGLITVGVIAMLTLGMTFGIVLPLRRHFASLIASTKRLAAGDLRTPVSDDGPADLKRLGRAIDVMRVQLCEQLAIRDRDAQQQRALFDYNPVPIYVFDRSTLALLTVNDAMAMLHGYTRNELLAMTLTDLTPVEHRAAVQKRISSHPGGILYIGVCEHVCKDGRIVHLELSSHSIMIDGRSCLMMVGIDVTNTRKVEEQLRQTQKLEAIGQLAGGVAHDFNNVLAVITMNAELLAGDLGSDHPGIGDIAEISMAAEQGARLTRQLLEFSRRQPQERKPIALNSHVAELQKMLSRVIGDNIQLTTTLASALPAIVADAGQLEQVIMNLVINARDAMPTGGRLAIETAVVKLDDQRAEQLGTAGGAYVMLAVTDSGTGMDAATKARIFEPFFTTKEVGKGTGLGLANVFGIVAQSEGAIEVDSELGRGTTFRIYFPISSQSPRGASKEIKAMPDPGGQTVLVVEDNEQVRTSISRILGAQGYRCFEARNGDTALHFLEHTTDDIDLMITDVVMPGMDGRALSAHARKLRPGLRVLLMSGYTQHSSVKTRSDEPYLQKPFTSAKLVEAIGTALEVATPRTEQRRRSSEMMTTKIRRASIPPPS